MDCQDTANQLAVIVCAPNAGQRLTTFLDALAATDFQLIVVTSRIEDPTVDVLVQWCWGHPEVPIHEINLSPRRALMAAFATATSLGCTHAATLLADAEFDPRDLPALLQSAVLHPSALITGYRPGSGWRTTFIRLCNFLLWLETGVHLRNSQCAARVYPLRLIETIRGKHKRHLRHTDLLAWAAWAGCPIVEARLASAPLMPAPRRSFLTELRYKLAQLELHAGLLVRELSGLPYPHYEGGAQRQPFWRGLWQWCNPLRAWRELRQGGITRGEMAAGVAVGVFIANMPAYGVQTAIGLYAARRLHLNPVAVVAGTQAAMPPFGIVLNAAAIKLGHLMLHGSNSPLVGSWSELNPFHGRLPGHLHDSSVISILLDWITGSIVVGIATAALSFVASNLLFRLVEKPAPKPSAATEEQEPAETLASLPP